MISVNLIDEAKIELNRSASYWWRLKVYKWHTQFKPGVFPIVTCLIEEIK